MKRLPSLTIVQDTGEAGPWRVVRQRDFTGGENLAQLPEQVGQNQLAKCENAILGYNGYLTDVFQMDSPTITNTRTINGIVFGPPDTTGQYPYWHTSVADTDTIVSGNYSPASVNDISLGSAHGSITMNTAPLPKIEGLSFAVPFLNKYYCPNANGGILNLTDYTRIYNGGLLDKVVYKLRQYSNYLWAVFTDGSLGYSNNGDATTWDGLDVIRLPNQEKAIDFLPIQGGAIVYSRTSIYAMYGTSYTDIQFVKLKDNVMLCDGAVEVDNIVYICSNRGVVAVSLNGVKELPHNQTDYFKSNYKAWAAQVPGIVQGIYLYKFKAILYLIRNTYATQGFMYYIDTGAYVKVNKTLPAFVNCMLPMLSQDVDFIIYDTSTAINKSVYQSGNLNNNRTITIKTRNEDLGSTKDKYWRALLLTMGEQVAGVTIKVYLDGVATTIKSNYTLAAGLNTLYLNNLGRSKSLSVEIIVANTIGVSGKFTLQEIGLKYREVGPEP